MVGLLQNQNLPRVQGIDVREFNVVGDGLTDSREGIQTAIDEANAAGGGAVLFPQGLFLVEAPLTIRANVSMVGVNRLASRIVGNMNSPLLRAANTAFSLNAADRTLNAFLHNLGFDNRNGGASSACVEWSQISLGGIQGCDMRSTVGGSPVAVALVVDNNTINNFFRDVSITGAVRGYRFQNGANDNIVDNCRVSGCTDGFLVRPGVNGSVNNLTFLACKVETFTGIGFDVDGDGGANFAECTLMMPRLTSGPTGIHFGRNNPAQVRNSGVFMPHYDGISGNSLLDGSPAANRNWQQLQGIMFPLRAGAAGSNAQPTVNDFALLRYFQANTQWLFRNNLDTVPQDVVVDGVLIPSANGTQRITTPRIVINSTALQVGDFALSSRWGSTASISALDATDTRGRFTVTSAGVGQAANATITITFPDAAMVNAPAVQLGRSAGDQLLIANTWTTTTGTIVITFVGTPVAGETYEFTFLAIG